MNSLWSFNGAVSCMFSTVLLSLITHLLKCLHVHCQTWVPILTAGLTTNWCILTTSLHWLLALFFGSFLFVTSFREACFNILRFDSGWKFCITVKLVLRLLDIYFHLIGIYFFNLDLGNSLLTLLKIRVCLVINVKICLRIKFLQFFLFFDTFHLLPEREG